MEDTWAKEVVNGWVMAEYTSLEELPAIAHYRLEL